MVNTPRLIMMKGLPASGKSTIAESLQKEVYPDAVRVNKDLLRKMLHFGEYSWRHEAVVSDIEELIVHEMLGLSFDVIVDDTNLTDYHKDKWEEIAKQNNAIFIISEMNTTWEECVDRDANRKESVGEDVIKKYAMALDKVDGSFVICDLDGTLCDISGRRHFVTNDGKNWDKFFANIPGDEVREEVAERVRMLRQAGFKIVYVSGRPDNYEKETREWLAKNGLDFQFTLIMRKAGDKRPDTQVKKEMALKYFKDFSKVFGVIDDRPCVVRMWKELFGDDKVWDVGDGVEF